jgi:hypothetical protein
LEDDINPKPLVNAVVAALVLLENCGPDEVNPDTAVRGMENIGYELNRLTGAERGEFTNLLEIIATEESEAAEFIRNIPFMLGWVEQS